MRRMRLPIRSPDRAPLDRKRARTRAFTLVELLVVLTIIVILVGLTLGAFRRSPADRLNASARQLQSRILLARSIAARDQRVTGLRLVQSANDPWVVDTIETIKSPGYDTGTADIEAVSPTGPWRVTNNTTGEWDRLFQRNLIRNGSRIEIPAGTGRWYQLQNVTAADFADLVGHYSPSVWNTSAFAPFVPPKYQPLPDADSDGIAEAIPYRLELAPTVTAGEEPLRLETGTAIDLVASLNVPGFRYATTAPSTTPPSAGDLEILFAPGQGLNSETAAGGNIYLYISTLEDIELTRQLAPNHPANGTGSPVAAPIVPANPPSAPKTEPSALAIIAQTGNVISVPVDLTPSGNLASDPYSYARNGREANR